MRLEVTRKSDLAIRALVELAGADDRLKAGDLATRLDAAPKFLAQVLTELARRRWIESSPGPTGGYRLVVDVATLSVIDVVEALEGPTETGQCVVADTRCGEHRYCPLHQAWTGARAVLVDHLRSTTIERVALDPDGTAGVAAGPARSPDAHPPD